LIENPLNADSLSSTTLNTDIFLQWFYLRI